MSQPVDGGVANVVEALAVDQVRRGYDVHVACPAGSQLSAHLDGSGVRVHAWGAARSPGLSVPAEVRRLSRVLRRIAPDLLVLHSAKAGLAGRLTDRGPWRTVYAPHAWSFDAVDGVLATASTWWEVLAGRRTDVVVCVSDDERRRGRAAGVACPMTVVPNGVDVEARVPRPSGPARHTLGLTDAPTVVCVGRLARQKGQDVLLRAWPTVLATVPGARLLLVGDGPDRNALEALAPPGVEFTGARADVDEFLAAADVVVLPSRWEGSSLVSLEAMAAGRPLVASAVDGVREALGDTGVVVDPGDVDGLSEAVISLLADPTAAVAAGLAARQRVTMVGDLRRTLKAWDQLVVGLLSGTDIDTYIDTYIDTAPSPAPAPAPGRTPEGPAPRHGRWRSHPSAGSDEGSPAAHSPEPTSHWSRAGASPISPAAPPCRHWESPSGGRARHAPRRRRWEPLSSAPRRRPSRWRRRCDDPGPPAAGAPDRP